MKQAGAEWCRSSDTDVDIDIAACHTDLLCSDKGYIYWDLITQRVLPLEVNVTLCINMGDSSETYNAFAGSSRSQTWDYSTQNGIFPVKAPILAGPILPNFENIRDFEWFEKSKPLAWEQRKHQVKPFFRGSFQYFPLLPSEYSNLTDVDEFCEHNARARLVRFSALHPELVDARFFRTPAFKFAPWMKQKYIDRMMSAVGVDPLYDYFMLPDHDIDYDISTVATDLNEQIQVAVSLHGATGASSRTSRHFHLGSAVVLQMDQYAEWFVPYLTPWEHYIPLANVTDPEMHRVFTWVRDHPARVRKIARAGKRVFLKLNQYGPLLKRLLTALGREQAGSNVGSSSTGCPSNSYYDRFARWLAKRPAIVEDST